jgi:hypothetical protein
VNTTARFYSQSIICKIPSAVPSRTRSNIHLWLPKHARISPKYRIFGQNHGKTTRISERESNKVLGLLFEAQRNTISIVIVFHEMLIGSIIKPSGLFGHRVTGSVAAGSELGSPA